MSINAAIARHQQGDLAQAEKLYRQVLQDQPEHADALHLLGILCLQTGQPLAAAEWIGRSLGTNCEQPVAHLNHGVALQRLNRLEEALGCFERALSLAPDYADALNNRGDVLLTLQRPAEALLSLERAVAIQPNFPVALNNLGNALRALGRPGDALASYENALRLEPGCVRALNNRGSALCDLTRLDDALDSFERALRLDPDYGPALYNLGIALLELQRHEEALARFEQLLRGHPGDSDALVHRGIALLNLGRAEQAIRDFTRALLLNPGNAAVHYNRANALRTLERFDEALLDYQRALAAQPDFAPALLSCGFILIRLRRHREAIDPLQKLGELEADYPYARGADFQARSQICDWSDAERRRTQLIDAIRHGIPSAAPHIFLAVTDSAADQLECARANTLDRNPAKVNPGQNVLRRRQERIRLAYASGDLRNHAVAHLLVGMIERHDRRRFEVNAISFKPPEKAGIGRRVHDAFDRFVQVGAQNDADIAAEIRAMEADIVIDLAGYTEGSRLGIFAHRAAPVQVGYLGFAGTTGAPYIDYLVADEVVIPRGEERWYTEQIVRLPHCYLPNDDRRQIAQTPTRTEVGLPTQGFVFCAFTNAYKINPAMFDVWMRLLKAVPGSVLWLRMMNGDARDNLKGQARKRGIDAERLLFAPHVEGMPEHLARQSRADLFLDTLPYNAHSSACDALWAGLPVLSCAGRSFAGRVAASALTAMGLPELIADSLESYERKALELASDPQHLQSLRRHLERNRATAPLFDTVRSTRHMEAAFEIMHERALRGAPPAGFSVGVSGDQGARGLGRTLYGTGPAQSETGEIAAFP
jgi:predicted O-linked N-acetylglucosamine transferase (SPINDLY family)